MVVIRKRFDEKDAKGEQPSKCELVAYDEGVGDRRKSKERDADVAMSVHAKSSLSLIRTRSATSIIVLYQL